MVFAFDASSGRMDGVWRLEGMGLVQVIFSVGLCHGPELLAVYA
jgi:hypothetical protein